MVGVFGMAVPKTAKNFLGICQGKYRSPKDGQTMTYKGSPIDASYRRLLYAGLIGGLNESVYGGEYLPETCTKLKHCRPFMLSMVRSQDTQLCGSSFHLTFRPLPEADGRDMVFGEIINDLVTGDMTVMHLLFDLYSEDGKPKKKAVISDCGVIPNSEVRDWGLLSE